MTTLNPSQTTRAAKKNQLYEACAQRPEHVFSTAELDRLGICGGVQEVAVLCTELLHQNLFRMYRGEGEEVHFQVATKEQAKMCVGLSYLYTFRAMSQTVCLTCPVNHRQNIPPPHRRSLSLPRNLRRAHCWHMVPVYHGAHWHPR